MRPVRLALTLALATVSHTVLAQTPALPASGPPVKPRVFVILDSSTSMKEAPDHTGAGYWSYGTVKDHDTGDDVRIPQVDCGNKFCIAKQTVHDVLKDYVENSVRIGLGTYYQYLVEATPPDTRLSRCWYDVVWKSGQTLYYPPRGDYAFNEDNRLASTVGVDLSGAVAPSGSPSNHFACTSSADTTYDLTEERTPNPMPTTCYIYDRPVIPPAPFTLGAVPPVQTGCAPGKSYAVPTFVTDTNGGSFYRYRQAAGVACPAAVPMGSDYTAAPASSTIVVSPGINDRQCGSPNCWFSRASPTFGRPTNTYCSASHPCVMYSAASGTEVDTNSLTEWLGFFDGSCTGGSQPLAPNGTDSSATTGVCAIAGGANRADFYQAGRVDGTVSVSTWTTNTNTNNCQGLTVGTETRRVTGDVNGNANTSYADPFSILAAAGLPTAGFSRVFPPTQACSGDWPCDVKLTSNSAGTPALVTTTVNHCTPDPVGPPTVTCSPLPSVMRRLMKTGASCPALGTATSNPPGYWESTPGCGVGNAECSFTPNVMPESTPGTIPGCPATALTWNGSTPVSCNYGGDVRPYTFQSATGYQAYEDISPTGVCNATVASMAFRGVDAAAEAQLGLCRTGTCALTSPVSTVSPDVQTVVVTNSTTAPDATWSSPSDAFGATIWKTATGPCPAADQEILVVDGQLVRFERGTGPGGTTQNGTFGDGSARFDCRYTQVSRTWSRNPQRCTYTFTRSDWRADNSLVWCQYDLAQERREESYPRYACTYELKVRKFDFTRPLYRECNFYRTATRLERNQSLFRYSYSTHGGELIGATSRDVSGHVCDASTPYTTFSATCPATIDNCRGGGTQCQLRTTTDRAPEFSPVDGLVLSKPGVGRFTATLAAAATRGGYLPVKTFGSPPTATANHVGESDIDTLRGGRACRITDSVTPPSSEVRAAYCAQNPSSPPVPSYKLVGDYLSCADPDSPGTCDPNALGVLAADTRTDPQFSLKPGVGAGIPAGSTFRWTNTPTKSQGLSATGVDTDEPAPVLMRFAADNDATGGLPQFQSLLSKCERPGTIPDGGTNLSWPNWATRGVCMPDTGTPSAAMTGNYGDYTPLYGSLATVKRYLRTALSTDDGHQCRPYYVVLATDGKENTPAGHSQADLESAVTALRSLTTSNGRSSDVKTFVLGFGDGTSDPLTAASLNSMALAGGTTSAYFAADRATLQTRLTEVFANILRGSFSRSKPALSTDGKTVYAAFFDRSADTPEWRGHFTAYVVGTDGRLTVKWEFGQPTPAGFSAGMVSKLDTAADSSRTLYTDVAGTREDFSVANASAFATRLNTSTGYPGGPGNTTVLDPARIVRFVRNANLAEPYFVTSGPTPVRTTRLNAIVSSAPSVVDRLNRPPLWGGLATSASSASYASYQVSVGSRESRVLVGASDGLLRAIRDNTSITAEPACATDSGGTVCPDGREAWGWVPSPLHPLLYKSMLSYTGGVDGQIATEDVCRDSTGGANDCTVSDWKTIAITSMGGGARGLVALDVTRPDDPTFLWSLKKEPGEDQLGYAPAPVVGRVELSSKESYVAIVPGGRRHNGAYSSLSDSNGDEIYVLDALTGSTVKFFNDAAGNDLGADDIWGEDNQFAARPSYFRRAVSPAMDNAFLSGTAGLLYTMRFRRPVEVRADGTVESRPRTDPDDWEPKVFFDPTASGSQSRDPGGNRVDVRRVIETVLPSGEYQYTQTTCDTLAGGSTCGELPLPNSRRLPFYQRPKLATVYDNNQLTPDVFLATGDALSPDAPGPDFVWNYVYAVHDTAQHDDGHNDGRPLWVNQLIDEREQVLTEPAMANGNLLVASYLPPAPSSGCDLPGDTLFYCFDPRTGDLRDCLVRSDGSTASVLRYPNVGIPSDPLVVNGHVYWMSSNPPPGEAHPNVTSVVATTQGGVIRSFRRIK